ncbi:GTPase [Rhodococcus erythropolis]|uniref:GTPase n=1 Tax=Rhodococcus erythropolis TaxID=1833 RepID=UPI00114CAE61|nr:GTPase [Rhodococcus erythropolis]
MQQRGLRKANMAETGLALQRAVEQAVRSGERELDSLDSLADSLISQFAAASDPALAASVGAGLTVELAELADGFANSLRNHLTEQRKALSTFNVAFFGRTGAGKSTLLSAFGGLDGGYVSPGESDWTTDVTEIAWHGCRLWDTPGINGWGRTQTRVDLEETARRAVEIADVVLLCFDSQSQQASEFTKVAQWVRAYGKPAVAVLNVRNLRWRHPDKVASHVARQSLSRGVGEHVDNIRTELSKIDLPSTPVVAIQSRRALFARASTPFKGPAEANFLSDREKFGTEYLSRWSNFAVLEELLVASIVEGGSDLRRTSLREGLRGMLDAKATALDQLGQSIDPRIDAAERRIAQLLDVLGYVDGDERTRYLGGDSPDLLSALEEARGRPFTASTEGSLDRQMNRLITFHLSGLREDSITRAKKLVEAVFDDDKQIGQGTFQEAVFTMSAIQAAVESMWKSKTSFLLRELQLARTDEAPDITGTSTDSANLDGTGGALTSNLARSMQAAGMFASAASGALLLPAAANFWNPGGWAGITASVSLGAVSFVSRFAGDRIAASTEKQGAAAKSKAISESLAAVHQTYDRIEQSLLVQGRVLSWQVAKPILTELLTESLSFRSGKAATGELLVNLREVSASLPVTVGVQTVMTRAQDRVLADRLALMLQDNGSEGPDVERSACGRKVWLGEDWFEYDSGNVDEIPSEASRLPVFVEQENTDRADLVQALTHAWRIPSNDSVAELIREIEAAARPDAQVVKPTSAQMVTKPTVVVLGDYSSGKSSLIKRLLVEMSGKVPENLHVRGSATTSSVQRYNLGHVQLLDTPGFQSGNHDHDAQALASAGDASLILVVLHVNLLIGDMALLQDIVQGTRNTIAKNSRTIYLINRSDELGVDPTAAPDDFLLLKRRKESELIAALASRGIEVDPTHVHTLSGDPFGEVGARVDVSRADYAHHRDWDGVAPLVRMLDSFSAKLGRAGVAGAQLDTALNAMLNERSRIEQKIIDLESETTARASVQQSIKNSVQDSELLEASVRERARRIVAPHANAARAKIQAAGPDEIDNLAATINSWKSSSELDSDIERFWIKAQAEIEDWFRTHASTIGREMASVDFVSELRLDDGVDGALPPALDGAELAADIAKGGAKIAKALGNRDVIYAIGKGLGHNFKPWEAVKTAGKVAKAAPILAAVGVAMDAAAMIKGEVAQKNRESKRREWDADIAEAADDHVILILNGAAEDGLIPVLHGCTRSLADYGELLEAEQTITDAERAALTATHSEIEQLLARTENLRQHERRA